MSKLDSEVSSELLSYLKEIGYEQFEGLQSRKSDKIALNLGKELAFFDYLSEALQKGMSKNIKALSVKSPPKLKSVERVLNLAISDTHFGSNLDPRETGREYGPKEESRRLASVFHQAVNYKTEHRNSTTLVVHLLGDLIQGQLHDPRDGVPLAEQMADTINILSQGIRYLSLNFPKVQIFVTPGNHGRNKARHLDRATFQKWDSNETIIYYSLKSISQMAGWKNVEIYMTYQPYYLVDELGHVVFGTHGDTVLNPGNPHNTINVGALTNQINKIVAAERRNSQRTPSVFVMGHVHIGTQIYLPGDITVFTNGCLIPPDSFSNSIGVFDAACGQQMWETTERHAVGDSRFIKVGADTDSNSDYDTIIQPFKGF